MITAKILQVIKDWKVRGKVWGESMTKPKQFIIKEFTTTPLNEHHAQHNLTREIIVHVRGWVVDNVSANVLYSQSTQAHNLVHKGFLFTRRQCMLL